MPTVARADQGPASSRLARLWGSLWGAVDVAAPEVYLQDEAVQPPATRSQQAEKQAELRLVCDAARCACSAHCAYRP